MALWLALLSVAEAQSTAWKGTSSSSWNTAANWTAGVPTASLDAVIGDANFTGANQPAISANAACHSLTLGTGTNAFTLTIARQTLTVSGNLTIGTNGTLTHTATKAITLTGNWTNSGTYAGNAKGSKYSSVIFAGTSQFVGGSRATAFQNLTINSGSTVTFATNISVAHALSVSGTTDPGAGSGFVISGGGTMTVNSGGTLLVRATTFAGNYTITGKTLNGGSTVDYTSSGNQTVDNTLTYSALRVSSGGVKTLAGNLPALVSSATTYGTLDVAAGTLDLFTNTVNRGTTVAGGTFTVEAGATLKIGGTNTFPVNYAAHSLALTSTVEYGGTNQVVTVESYGNLVLSSSGAATKTLPASAMTVAGNLSSATNAGGASVAFTAGAAITVNGSVTLGGGTTFNGGAFSHSVGGNWTNSGTFAGGTGTLTMGGINTILTGAGAYSFYNLTLAAAGITADTNTSLTVAGNFVTSGLGTFTHTPGGTGTITMSGAGGTISGTGITFSRLTISGTNTTSATFTVADDLTVNGALTNSAGTITLSGTGKKIAGSGAILFGALFVPGSLTTTNDFSLAGNFNVSGSFTAAAGNTTFAGATIFNGSANLFNATLNGTLLRLGANSLLGLAGTTTLTAGAFDATNQAPNTVVYNSTGNQTVYPITYDNLEIAAGGTKTPAGSLSTLANLTIDAGAVFNGGNGGYTNYVSGNWLNYGTFTASNSTVEMAGPSDATISGATTFNQLRVNKNNSTVLVNLATNQTVATLDMTTGTMNTGTNRLTLTTTRVNNGIVLGTITRQHGFAAGTSYAFESPNNTITFAALTNVSSVTVSVAVGNVGDFPSGASINRQYTVSLVTTNLYNATFREHYENSELNGNIPSLMSLYQNPGTAWALSGKTANDTSSNWVEQTSLTNLTGRWTLAGSSGIVRWNGSASTVWETPGNWTVVSGSPSAPPSTNDIVELGTTNVANQPTISSAVAVKSISFGSAQAITLTLGAGGSLQTIGNVAGIWTNNATHIINVGAQSLTVGGALTLSDGTSGHAINLNYSSGTVTVASDLTESGGASIACSSNGNLIIYGNFNYVSGTFTPGSGTVKYTGSGAQTVAPVTYNQLTFDSPSGISTLASSTTVNGSLTLTNHGTFHFTGNLSVAGSVLIRTNTTLDPASSATAISVGGDWVCGGTLNTGNGGVVVLNGTGAQAIGTGSFYELDINKPSGTATLGGNITSYNAVQVFSGTLDLSTFALNAGGAASFLTASTGTTLRTAGSFPGSFNAVTLDRASTVEYYAAGNQTVATATYGNLSLTNGVSNSKTLGGASTVAGNLLIASNAILAASANNLTMLGNWTNNGTFNPGTGLVSLNGTNKAVAGNTTFTNLTVGGSYTAANNSITINGATIIYGSYTATNCTTTIVGDLNNAGTLLNYATLTFSGTRAQTLALNSGFLNNGTVNFNGSVAPVMSSTTSPQNQNVNINNTGGITLDVGWNVSGAFTVAAGAGFNGGIYTHTFSGTVTNNGTMSSSGTLNFNPTNATTLALGTNFSSTGSVIFGGTQPLTISSSALSLGSVEIANTYAAGITPVSNWTLAGVLRIDGGATFHAGALTHKLAGNVNNNGTLDGGTSLVIFNGTSVTAGSGSTVFYNLLVSSNLTAGADISVTLNFTNNGTFENIIANLNFTGGSSSIIAGTAVTNSIDSLVVAKNSSTNTVTLAANVTNLTSLAISQGVLDTSTFTLSEDPVITGALIVNANSTFRLGGTSSFPTFTSGYAFNAGSTVEYAGGAQTVLAVTNAYANLKLSGSGNKTLNSIVTINGNVDISGTAKFNLSYSQNSSSAVGSLSYAGALQAQNTTYGSTTSTAANKTDTYFQSSGKLTVGSIIMDHFLVTVSGTPVAKTPFVISITAQDVNNNTVAAFTNLVSLTETGDGVGGTVSPTNSSYFSGGVLASQSVTLSKAGAAVTLTVIGTNTPGTTTYTNISDPFTVSAATPDLSWATPTNIVYGTALGTNQNNATSSLAGTFVYNPTNGAVLPTGTNTLSVLFTPTDTNYTNKTQTVFLVVTPAPLGITANNTNRTYNATNPVFTYAVSGLVNGDTVGVLSGSPSLTSSATTNSASGSYVITNTVGTLSATNYSFNFTNGTLTVNKTLPVLIWPTPTNIVYGTVLGTNQNNVSASVAGTLVYNPTNGTVLLAATNTLSVVFTATDTNYVGTNLSVVLVVTAAPLTVTANNQSKTYGTALTFGTGQTAFASTGLQNGETIGSVTITASGGTATNGVVGTYNLTPSAATGGTFTAGNYSINYTNGTLTVSKSVLGITANSTNRTYGAVNPTFTYTASGFVNGENSSVLGGSPSLTTTATNNSAVGVYPIVATNGTLSAANYSFSFTNGTLTVNAAGLGITANNQSKTYGATLTLGVGQTTFTSSGLQNSETIGSVTLTASGGTNATAVAGGYTITPSAATGGTFSAGNYTITYTNGTLTVNQASTTISVSISGSPIGYHDSVSFTANLPTNATGSVTFISTNGPISTNALTSGSATSLSITNLPRGTNTVTVQYAGDSNYLGSTNTLAGGQIVTNHPPAVGNVILTRALTSTKIFISTLGANVSDVDGDALTFSAGSTSTNGVIVTSSSSLLFYFNTNSVNDQFTYTVSDGFGGSATGNITMNFFPFKTGQQGTISVSNGVAKLAFNGIPTLSYGIERSTNLVGWTSILTTNAPSNGDFQYTDKFSDLGGIPPSAVYYRLHWNP